MLKNRVVAIIDLPGAFLHAKNDETMVFTKEKMAELIFHVHPKIYKKHIYNQEILSKQAQETYYNNKESRKIKYRKVQKALYGMLKSALMFYKKIKDDPENSSFEVNPYDHALQTQKSKWKPDDYFLACQWPKSFT